MENKYKHLKNGYTAIFFTDSNNKENAFFIDTNYFEIANSQEFYWHNQLVNSKGNECDITSLEEQKVKVQKHNYLDYS